MHSSLIAARYFWRLQDMQLEHTQLDRKVLVYR